MSRFEKLREELQRANSTEVQVSINLVVVPLLSEYIAKFCEDPTLAACSVGRHAQVVQSQLDILAEQNGVCDETFQAGKAIAGLSTICGAVSSLWFYMGALSQSCRWYEPSGVRFLVMNFVVSFAIKIRDDFPALSQSLIGGLDPTGDQSMDTILETLEVSDDR